MLIILRFNWLYNFFLGYFGGNGERHKEELHICFMVQIFRILIKMFPVNDCFSECYYFHSSMFLTFEEAVFLPAHSYLLFSGFLLLGDGA